MKKLSILLLFIFMGHLALMAQNMSETEVRELMNEAFLLNNSGNYRDALAAFLKVGQKTKEWRTEDERKVYLCSQTMAVMCLESLEQYEDGYILSGKLLEDDVRGDEKKDLQHMFVNNGYLTALTYMRNNNCRYEEAGKILERILPLADTDMSMRIKKQMSTLWYFEGLELLNIQDYNSAINYIKKAKDGYHEVGAAKNEIEALAAMCLIKKNLFDLDGAMAAYRQVCKLADSIHYDLRLMPLLREYYVLSERLGNSELSIAISDKMDSLAAATPRGDVRFEYYNQMGTEALRQKNFVLAERWFRKNDRYIDQLDKNDNGSDRYLHFENLKNLYSSVGKYDIALSYALLCKDEYQKHFDAHKADYYLPYIGISNIYSQLGDSVMCFRTLDTLFNAVEKYASPLGKHNCYVARAMCNAKFKHYEQALADYMLADKILAASYGEDDQTRLNLLPLMGGMEYKLGHYEESERLFKKYSSGVGRLYGENQLEYVDALGYQANAEAFSGHIEAACNDYSAAVGKLKNYTQQRLQYLNSAEREGFWQKVSKLIRDMTPFALEANEYQSSFTEACYDGLVLLKGFLLETERSTFDLIKNNGTEDDLRDYSRIISMQSELVELEREGASQTDRILELVSEIKQLELHLSRRCHCYGDVAAFMSIGYDEVKAHLRDGEVLIDFTDFVSKQRERVYAAYFVNNKQQYPLLLQLFAESRIDSMRVVCPDQYYEHPYAEMIYQILWKPFEGMLDEGTTVYYVPSQFLFRLAPESLPTEDGSLLGEHYHFVRLSSAREVARHDFGRRSGRLSSDMGAILYGGLQYDLDSKDWEDEAKKYNISLFRDMCRNMAGGESVFRPLPGTKKEVEAIETIFKSHNLSVESFTGKGGTEESFLAMSGHSPQILHVATHGFFFTPDEARVIDSLNGYEDAMSLSGLVMSGGNAAWSGRELPKGVLSGILTASVIARLDLSNTELVVLSACQSGTGKITSEGLYGLQRAFKKAGAKTLVMSLWNVSDTACCEFMRLFYSFLLTDSGGPYDKYKAFARAKNQIREKFSEPYYWAGFVMLD